MLLFPMLSGNRMMASQFKIFDAMRRNLAPVQNSAVDLLLSGKVDRRDFLRHGSVVRLLLLCEGVLCGCLFPRRHGFRSLFFFLGGPFSSKAPKKRKKRAGTPCRDG